MSWFKVYFSRNEATLPSNFHLSSSSLPLEFVDIYCKWKYALSVLRKIHRWANSLRDISWAVGRYIFVISGGDLIRSVIAHRTAPWNRLTHKYKSKYRENAKNRKQCRVFNFSIFHELSTNVEKSHKIAKCFSLPLTLSLYIFVLSSCWGCHKLKGLSL